MSARLDIPKVSKAFFATVMPFRTDEGRSRYDFDSFRRTIQEVLAQQEAAAGTRRVDPEIYEHAKYAMVGLVDELAIVSDWAYATDWKQDPLELTIFQSNVAGEEFFERLKMLRDRFGGSRDEKERETILGALEVYFTCLECGFKGRLRHGGEGELNAVRSGLLGILWPESDHRQHARLFPEAYLEGAKAGDRRRSWNRWLLIFLVVLLLAAGVYVFFSLILGARAGDIKDEVDGRANNALERKLPEESR
jgi:type IV/VI secretion system ImpK/VasF family protein